MESPELLRRRFQVSDQRAWGGCVGWLRWWVDRSSRGPDDRVAQTGVHEVLLDLELAVEVRQACPVASPPVERT